MALPKIKKVTFVLIILFLIILSTMVFITNKQESFKSKNQNTCTPEHNDTWASGKHIACCSGLKEELIKGRYICESGGGCTPENGDTWASGKHIGCCSGLKKIL